MRLSHFPKGGALSWANSVTATASRFREVVPPPLGAGLSSLLPENLANGSSQGLSPSPQLCMDIIFAPPSQLALPRTLPWQFGCCMPHTLSLDRLRRSHSQPSEKPLTTFTAPRGLFLEYHLLTPQLGLLHPFVPGDRSKSFKGYWPLLTPRFSSYDNPLRPRLSTWGSTCLLCSHRVLGACVCFLLLTCLIPSSSRIYPDVSSQLRTTSPNS